jgi:predicted phosphodiesterase
MRVAVLGDIHANVRALQAALKIADEGGYDQLILLGDLLTYGVDVVETLELVGDRLASGRTVLLHGNHDALYRDLLEGNSTYHDQLPIWIKESVEWTLDRLPLDIWSQLSFKDELRIQQFLFSHANPFGPEKWQYLNTAAEHAIAAEALLARGIHVGVFGHTHRTKWYRYVDNNGFFNSDKFGYLDYHGVHILNAGSIGQPRDKGNPEVSVLWVTIPNDPFPTPSFKLQSFSWDVTGHMQGLATSELSTATSVQLSEFFENTFNDIS